MSTSNFRFRNLLRIRMRSVWSRSPCKNSVCLSRKSLKFCVSSSALEMDFTKINTCPFAIIPSILFESHGHFSSSFLMTSTTCATFCAACPASPIVTLTGLCRMSRARRSILGGNVAENSSVWRLGLTFCMIDLIWYSKPRWNMRSASSSTAKVTRLRLQPFILTMSIRRPGLQMAISQPRLISLNCSSLDSPPARVTLRRPMCLLNLNTSFSICTASSRVGQRTMLMGPSSFANAGCAAAWTSMGSK
mmetsp:Transcript_93325/g.263443  ORF Transcript_93325/g.263443 Transcript_93325/m.263443 type:complete len:248 (+) Transcript_93325:1412-2155(+)